MTGVELSLSEWSGRQRPPSFNIRCWQGPGLWHAVEPEEGETIEYREDQLAFATIITICAPTPPYYDREDRVLEMLASLSNIEQLRKELSERSALSGPSSGKGGKKPWKSWGARAGKMGGSKEGVDRYYGKRCQMGSKEGVDRYCGKRCHLSKNCWSKLRNKETAEKAHVAQLEEELPKSMEVINDGITAPVSVEPEEELQLKSSRRSALSGPSSCSGKKPWKSHFGDLL